MIVVSEVNATADKLRGLDLGAVDYVTKPFDLVEIKARIRVALRTKSVAGPARETGPHRRAHGPVQQDRI